MEHQTEAAVYARVSTSDQRDEGTSLDTQRDECLLKAGELRWTIAREHVILEDWTGTDLQRPGLLRLLDLARSGRIHGIIIYTLDRLYRPENDGDEWRVFEVLQRFQDAGVEVAWVDPSIPAHGPLSSIFTFLDAWRAGRERRQIAERTMRGKKEAARQGRVPTGFGKFPGPYGLRYDKGARKFEWLSGGQKQTVLRVLSACLAGRSISSITNELNDAGIRALGGGYWHRSAVQKILRNARLYAGRYVWNGIPVPGVGPEPIVTLDEVERIGQRLQRNRERSKGFGKRTLLSGRVFGECGRAYTLSRNRGCGCGGRGTSLPKPLRCEDVSIGLVKLEGIVRGVFDELLDSPEAWQRALANARREWEQLVGDVEGQRDRLKVRLAELEKQRKRVKVQHLYGLIDDAELAQEAGLLKKERVFLEATLLELEAQSLNEPPDDVSELFEAVLRLRGDTEARPDARRETPPQVRESETRVEQAKLRLAEAREARGFREADLSRSLPDDEAGSREALLILARNEDDNWRKLHAHVRDRERAADLAQVNLDHARRAAELDGLAHSIDQALANLIDSVGLRIVVKSDQSLLLQARFPFEVKNPVSKIDGSGVSVVTTPS